MILFWGIKNSELLVIGYPAGGQVLEERRGLRAGKRVTLPDLRQLKILPNALFSLGRRGNRCAPVSGSIHLGSGLLRKFPWLR